MRAVFALALGAGVLMAGCGAEQKTLLTNTAFDGRYTDGDFKRREAGAAQERLTRAFGSAGFRVDRRGGGLVLLEKAYTVTPGRWVTTSEERVVDPVTGRETVNLDRAFEAGGSGSYDVTLTVEVVAESSGNGRLRGVRYRVWPVSEMIRMPIEGTAPEAGVTPYDDFARVLRGVVGELGAGPVEGTTDGAGPEGADHDG